MSRRRQRGVARLPRRRSAGDAPIEFVLPSWLSKPIADKARFLRFAFPLSRLGSTTAACGEFDSAALHAAALLELALHLLRALTLPLGVTVGAAEVEYASWVSSETASEGAMSLLHRAHSTRHGRVPRGWLSAMSTSIGRAGRRWRTGENGAPSRFA
jgi:hypothetical protein